MNNIFAEILNLISSLCSTIFQKPTIDNTHTFNHTGSVHNSSNQTLASGKNSTAISYGSGSSVTNNITINPSYTHSFDPNTHADASPRSYNDPHWFANRLNRLIDLLNASHYFNEPYNNYTPESIANLIGEDDYNRFKQIYLGNIEPNEAYRERFVTTFGVNRGWILSGNNNPFKSNITKVPYKPLEILDDATAANALSFIIVVGSMEKRNYMLIIRQMSNTCLEVYPKPYDFCSSCGNSGKENLANLYLFIKEIDRTNKLYHTVYRAGADETEALLTGTIAPKSVYSMPPLRCFSESFLDLDSNVNEFANLELYKIHMLIKEKLAQQ